MCISIFFKWKTENQLNIHLVYLLADKNKYNDSHLLWF